MNESHFFFFLLYVADMHNCKIEKKLRVMCRPKVRGVEKANSARLEVLAGVKVWFQFFKFWEITLNFLLDQGGDCWHNWVHPQHLGQQAKERSQSFNCRPSHRYSIWGQAVLPDVPRERLVLSVLQQELQEVGNFEDPPEEDARQGAGFDLREMQHNFWRWKGIWFALGSKDRLQQVEEVRLNVIEYYHLKILFLGEESTWAGRTIWSWEHVFVSNWRV